MQIATEIVADQRSPEWYEGRRGRATASKFATIVTAGRGAETYVAELAVERASLLVKESYTSKAMQDGIDNEATARLLYELNSGNVVKECGFFAHDSIHAGASPDGLVNDDGLIEVKCPIEATHLATLKTGKIPNQYYWQMVGQMWMTGRQWCDYASFSPYFPQNAQLFIKRVERDEAAIKELEDAVNNFLVQVNREEQFIKNYTGKGDQVIVTRVGNEL